MSVLDLLLPDRRGIIPQEFRPVVRHIPADTPPAMPPRPAAARRAPDPCGGGSNPAGIQAASKIVADRMAAKSNLLRGEECFSSTKAKAIRDRRAEDIQTALREAAAGEPLSILLCGDVWRMHCTLDCADPYREEPGAVQVQSKLVADLREQQALAHYADVHGPKLRTGRRESCQGLVGSRAMHGNPRIALAEEARRDGGPVVISTPALPWIGDQVARDHQADRQRQAAGRLALTSPDGRGEPLAAPSLLPSHFIQKERT